MSYGTLYLCATPIGNLQDITLRVLETLKTVDLVACEDTRKTLQLLNHFEISKPVTSYYEHNKMSKGDVIIQQLKDGKNIALVSDAGMPGISDPGYDLVQQCLAEDIPFTVLPGAVAAVTGLVLSGLPTDRFSFEGFIPRQKKERLQYFQNLVQEERTMIFYESPHRLEDTLKTLIEVFPDRPMAAARELTKKFEEIVRGTPSEVLAHFEAEGIRG
ncbi:MAG: 16S rRNA (cytidine(1402)-2'-O)-methyltransferase, partial [Peptococcaceae bacterium]|nr:16S rRNA (cytidine(1402)-2'-O)-methyltransferase [Peptococcaceae bacterium]